MGYVENVFIVINYKLADKIVNYLEIIFRYFVRDLIILGFLDEP